MPIHTKATEQGFEYEGFTSAGPLSVQISATADAQFRLRTFRETMILAKTGVLFERVHSIANKQIAMTYCFGPAVGGPRQLSLVAEQTPHNAFVYGQADGRPLHPVRFPVPVCGCSEARTVSAVMVDAGNGLAEPLEIVFPEGFSESLEDLRLALQADITEARFAPDQVGNVAWAGCFWANVACELAAKACIVGCPATGPGAIACIALCLAAEAACLAAVAESKTTSLAMPC